MLHKSWRWVLALTVFLPLALPFSVHAALPEVREFKLQNGMKVVLAPSSRVPSLTYFTFFHVGSRNERPGLTGVSHFMEHMMFLGAKKYGPGEFDRVMEQSGGANNAFTSQDMTAYNDDIPTEFFAKLVDMETDRMQDVTLDPKLFDSERHVVMEEIRLRDIDDPDGAMEVALNAAAYKASSYHWPVGGWLKDLDVMRRDEAYAYIKTFYAPNNATLVIAGNFDPAAAEKLIRERYGAITSAVQPPAPVLAEPEQLGPIRVELRKDVSAAALERGYKVPEILHADTPALDLLAEILAGGENSVLVKALVHEAGLATDVIGGNGDMKDPSLFEIAMHLRPEIAPEKARAALDAALAAFFKRGATPAEIAAAKARITIRRLRQMETNTGFASSLGRADILFGDWHAAFAEGERINAVTAADLTRVSGKYFSDKEMTEVTLVPVAAAVEPVASAPAAKP